MRFLGNPHQMEPPGCLFSPSELPLPAPLFSLLLTSAKSCLRKRTQPSFIFESFSTNVQERIKSLTQIWEYYMDSRILSFYIKGSWLEVSASFFSTAAETPFRWFFLVTWRIRLPNPVIAVFPTNLFGQYQDRDTDCC